MHKIKSHTIHHFAGINLKHHHKTRNQKENVNVCEIERVREKERCGNAVQMKRS